MVGSIEKLRDLVKVRNNLKLNLAHTDAAAEGQMFWRIRPSSISKRFAYVKGCNSLKSKRATVSNETSCRASEREFQPSVVCLVCLASKKKSLRVLTMTNGGVICDSESCRRVKKMSQNVESAVSM